MEEILEVRKELKRLLEVKEGVDAQLEVRGFHCSPWDRGLFTGGAGGKKAAEAKR